METDQDLNMLLGKFLRMLYSDKKLQKLYSFLPSPPSNVEQSILKEILSKPYPLEYNSENGELYFINKDGEKEICPELVNGVTFTSDWISDTLPIVPFDIEQGGNSRRANEAEYIYKASIIAGVLGGEFIKDINNVIENYDFEKLDKKQSGYMNFCELIEKWQSLQNLTIRVIISGANFKIASEKKSEAGFVIGSLSREETIGVVSIRTKVKNLIRGYMEDSLSPEKVKNLTKVERLQKIQEKDNGVMAEINKCPKFSNLYMICTMDADYIDANIKLTLTNEAKNFARKETLSKFVDDEPGFKKFISTCRRRAYKESLTAIKENELLKWREQGNLQYKLPPKR